MKDACRILQLYAFYLSKYDMDAVVALGYENRSRAISGIGAVFGYDNHYLKLRRDEFDVLTGSHRKGWRNRPVAKSVRELFDYYEKFSFDELTAMAKEFLNNHHDSLSDVPAEILSDYSESELEEIINYHDTAAAQRIENAQFRRRVLHREIINQLKVLYGYRCQICGTGFKGIYGVEAVEAHHIVPFAESLNNDANNLVILCPNHHRLIHIADAVFDWNSYTWDYHNGHTEPLALNYHLGKHQ